jgi:hypothetical protein
MTDAQATELSLQIAVTVSIVIYTIWPVPMLWDKLLREVRGFIRD